MEIDETIGGGLGILVALAALGIFMFGPDIAKGIAMGIALVGGFLLLQLVTIDP